jgi:putative ABC transport system permease protein
VLISEAFAEANSLKTGGTLRLAMNDRWQTVTVSGIALSPEFIYEIRPGDLFPDNKHFGVLWMPRPALAAAFDMDGAFNDVALSLAPGQSDTEIIAALDRVLEDWGGFGAYGRADQLSNRFISDEIAQARISGIIVPAIFLGVAAFLIGVIMSRLVDTQREQIATLRAFGYNTSAIVLHYVQLALVAATGGALAGVLLGIYFGRLMSGIYRQFYRFPVLEFLPDAITIASAVAITACVAVAGAAGAALRAGRMSPAEAMRPPTPTAYRRGILDRLGLTRIAPFSFRMAARSLERFPVRTAVSIFGIAMASAILVLGRNTVDVVSLMAEVQFQLARRDSATIQLSEPQSYGVLQEIANAPGVLRAEPFRSVPVRIRSAHHTRRIGLLGMAEDTGLRRVVGKNREAVEVSGNGVVLTTKLGEILQVQAGDTVTLEPLEGRRDPKNVIVTGLADELLGLQAYMQLEALNRLLGEERVISGAFVRVDASMQPEFQMAMKERPGVGSVSQRDAALRSFTDTLARNLNISMAVLVFFAGAIALATVYNIARIALSERARELASLRVLGFTRLEVASALLSEHAALVFSGIPIGLAVGYWACYMLSRTYSWEYFRFPLVVTWSTYGFAASVVTVSAALSALLVWFRVRNLNLVSTIKTRE